MRAPLATVRRLIDDGWLLNAFFHGRPDALSYVDVDHADGVVGFQGHWWYRGEIAAAEGPSGQTILTYRVFNVATRAAWAVPLANRLFIGYDRSVRDGVTGLAEAVDAHVAGTA
ncbi:hypothetical protein Val02_29560 [Virgisporangium aliadipatigenens]|uniref:Uncharacterized protein n=1 Tax=Virgisporangium aliadipatigenens TaxID=741659 RepID=A0A8J3YLB8_9ACTN|nr:hypothetical protein Val02_29560 [Virgisporangium aliadipatigenens]